MAKKRTPGEVRERLGKTEDMETSYVTEIYEPFYGERNVRVKFKIKK